ncbi:MAG: MFS transporter [Anaerolineales bacterium]
MNPRSLFSPISSAVHEYSIQLRAFSMNARLYLLNVIIVGAAMGVFRLLFNFYVLSLGYDEALLGRLITISNLTALLAALPMGYLADLLGRKYALLLSGALMSASIMGIVLWPSEGTLYGMNVVSGIGQSLGAVSMAPFLMENSGEKERTYLFSFSSGLQMAMASVGNWIGGYLPTWIGNTRGVPAISSQAYAGSLMIVSLTIVVGLIPLIMLRTPRLQLAEKSVFAPIAYASKNPVLLGKLILPMLITAIGAGLIMPFMNLFFRQVHGQPDPVIGSLFAWGSLAMGLGLLLAPPLADRMGKIQFVVVTQSLSIPFLIVLGFSPYFWMSAGAYYIRLTLMNMSSPVYQTFVMEHVEPPARATVASLVSMAWNFGWAFSPTLSGYLQVQYGFGPPFLGTIILYTISTIMYYIFFLRGKQHQVPDFVPGD